MKVFFSWLDDVRARMPARSRVMRLAAGMALGFVPALAGGVWLKSALDKDVQFRTLADSVREFSDEQGRDGWFYGYFDMNVATGEFIPMQFGGGYWRAETGRYLTEIFMAGGMTNGQITAGREAREHWTVRRWRSDYTGRVRISGRVSKFDGRGDGVTVRVDVNGVEVWSQRLGPFALGTDYSFFADVSDRANVDFIITPHRSDYADMTVFTAVIEAVE